MRIRDGRRTGGSLFARKRRGRRRRGTQPASWSWKGMSSFDEFLPCASRRRALTNRSLVFTHVRMLPRSRRRTWDHVYPPDCVYAVRVLRNHSRMERQVGESGFQDYRTNEAYIYIYFFLSVTFSVLRSERVVKSRKVR